MVNSARKVSGAEEYLLDLAENISKDGYCPSFCVKPGGILESRVKNCGYTCHAVFGGNPLSVPLAVAAALRSEQPDIVLIGRDHNIYPVIAGYLLARPWLKRRPEMVATLHTPTGRRYPFTLNFLNGIIASSDYTGNTFYPVNPGWEKIARTIHCGIKVPAVMENKGKSDRPRRLLTKRQFPIIGMVGELWKNQSELIDIGAVLQQQYPDITVVIAGGGDDAELRSKIAGYGLEKNFVLTGRIPREQISDLFYDLDISVSTHRNEGFGIVHIESLAAATPVIAYNCGGLVEIVRNGGGLLVDGGTVDITREIIALLNDHDRRRAMGTVGRRVFEEKFTVERMAKQHVNFFNELLSP